MREEFDKLQVFMDKAIKMGMEYGPKLILAIIVLIVGLRIIKSISKGISSALSHDKVDDTLKPFITSLVTWILKGLLFISVASMIGVETTSFVAVLGAMGLAVGLALQGSLGNFAGGVLVLIFQPFKVGDYIVAQGEEGIVERIDIFCTFIKTLDNQIVILPNGPLAGGNIKNVTKEPIRRVDLSIGVSYNDDVPKAIETLNKMCASHPKVISDPAPYTGVVEYGDNSINLTVRPWCKTADYWDVFFDLNLEMKKSLDAGGFSIPYPQRDLHIISGKMS